jgi:membrane peptidoglycan carboxypeptidase
MAERPNTPNLIQRGGWHEPTTPSSVKPISKANTPQNGVRVLALPSNLSQRPPQSGAWHLPAPQDTIYNATDQIMMTPKGADTAPTIRPEDLIADILGSRKETPKETPKTVGGALPEDMTPLVSNTAPKATSTAVPTLGDLLRPEDDILPKSEPEATPTVEPLPLDDLGDMGGLEALGAMDDAPSTEASISKEQDPFSISEYLALAHLEQQAAKSQDADTVPLTADDLSPAAQAALLAGVQQATELLPKTQQPTSAEEDAAAYARRMAQQYSQGDSGATLVDQVAQGEEDAAAYARRMAQQYSQGDEYSTVNVPMTGAQPAQSTLTPQEEVLAEQFRRTAQGVNELRQQYQNGLISQADVQNRQRDYQILDERTGDWWMMGIETGVWYRFDRAVNNWVESQPPVPLNRPSVPTATSGLNPDEIVGASMPYFATSGVQEYSGEPTQGFGRGDTPIPNPNQPQFDPNLTMVSDVASMNTLPHAADTLQGMGYVDQNTYQSDAYQNTMPMQGVNSAPSGDFNNLMTEAPSYDQQGVPDIYRETRQRESQGMARTLAILGLVAGIILAVGLVAGVVLLQLYYNNTIEPYAEEIASLKGYKPSFQTARILDASGNLIVELNSQDGGAREVITLDQMSPFVLHAVISTENPTFYNDPGFDLFAVARALLQNLAAGEIASGASTITQQLARNLILKDTSPTAERKIAEIFVAMEISRTYSKNEILQLYMNETFFGNQSYGVEAAAEFYFDKQAIDLNMGESAVLAGIISSPAQFDPVVNLEASKAASRVVIGRMLEANCLQFQHGQYANTPFCINETTTVDTGNGNQAKLVIANANGTYGGVLALQLAQVETRKFLPRQAQFKYPHFVNYVQSQIEQEFGVNAMFARGFTIYTTLNPTIQDEAERTLRQQVSALSINGVNTGAVMVTDPQTGAIRAMVGSPDFTDEQNNGQVDNTRTWQQPGSTIKAVVYTAALEGGPNGFLTPASILWDVPSSYGIEGQAPYQPTNFSNQFFGPTPLRFALQNSYNVSAVKAYEFIGNEKFVDTAARMGLQFLPEAQFGLPTALGANEVRLIDMMKVYGTLANGGVQVPLYSIDRITEDVGGATLEVPLTERPANQQAVSPLVAYLMQNILSDDNARSQQFGLNSLLTLANKGIQSQDAVAAKSGTSNEGRDLWTMGFTSNTVVGVWLGTWDNSPTRGVSGANAPATVWNRIMGIATNRQPTPFQRPSGVVQAVVCRETGALSDNNVPCPTRANEIFINTQAPPPAGSGFVQTISVDSWTGLVANEWCSENVVSKVVANIPDPFAVNWIVNTPQGTNWAARVGLPMPLQPAPTGACSQGQVLPSVYLNNPVTNQSVTGVLTITGQVNAPEFQRYDLEYATSQNPTAFQRITTNTQQFVNGGSTLGTWDTTTVPNGTYIVRLAAYSNSGGSILRTAQINIQNILPTATPMPLPTSTPNVFIPTPIQFGATPIPFDPIGTTPTATLAP